MPFKKLFMVIGAIAVGLAIVFLVLRHEVVRYSTTSPLKTYSVQITTNSLSEVIPFLGKTVNFSISKDNVAHTASAHLTSHDYFDGEFRSEYRYHQWIDESILRISRLGIQDELDSDLLILRNKSNKRITYFKAVASDFFLFLDVEPNSSREVGIPRTRWNNWVSGDGVFDDGLRIPFSETDFFHRGKVTGPMRFYIDVTEDGIRISNPDILGSEQMPQSQ